MTLRVYLFYFLSFCVLFSNAKAITAFELYAQKQQSLMSKAYTQRDAKTQTKLMEDFQAEYEKLSGPEKEIYRALYSGSLYNLSCTYALNNDKTKAIEYLGRSIKAGNIDFSNINTDTDLDNIRNEKEFKYLVTSSKYKYQDSLNKVIKEFKLDTNTIISLWEYANFYYAKNDIDSAMLYLNRAYELAVKLNNERYQVSLLWEIEQAYSRDKNFEKALELSFEILMLCESMKDSMGMADTWLELGGVYDNLGDDENSILYNKKAYALYKKKGDNPLKVISSANNIGYKYTVLGMPDSALHYFQESNGLFNNEIKNLHHGTYAFTLYGLGKVNYQLGNLSIAIPYYKESLALIDKRTGTSYDNWIHGLDCMGLGELFKSVGHADSAIAYYKEALVIMPEEILKPIIYKNLALLYKNIDKDIAIDYLLKEVELTDSLYNDNNKREIKNLTLNEQERQKKMTSQHLQNEEEQKQNIQYALMALGIVTFIILFLLLSRSFITNTKLIEFLGVMALLIVFEFLNLLLHPFIERITNHSQLLMLFTLVCIAALLIPLHHRVEKWTTKILVEKNKAIRLANAKKTIEKLSEKSEPS